MKKLNPYIWIILIALCCARVHFRPGPATGLSFRSRRFLHTATEEIEVGKKYTLVDAQAMAEKHPDTFEVNSIAELKLMTKVGFHVKICLEPLDRSHGGERPWVLVTAVGEYGVTGTIDNHLVSAEEFGIDYPDEIEVEWRNVYTTLKPV